MTLAVLAITSAFVLSLVLTPVIRDLARDFALFDRADGRRKLHAQPTPRLGGIAIVVAFFATICGQVLWVPGTLAHDDAVLLTAGLAMALLGAYDDLRGADAKLKLAVQLAVAIAVVMAGVRIERLALPFGVLPLGPLAGPLTVAWIVGVTNAVNLIDGLDGLAAGVALVALAAVALLVGGEQPTLLIICVALAGAVLGFWAHNRHPATIFMGDSGALFLGAMLSLLTVRAATRPGGGVVPFGPLFLLAVPLLDTTLSFARRVARGGSPFKGDADHLHHRIMRRLGSHRGAVRVLHASAVSFAGAGLLAIDDLDLMREALVGMLVATPVVMLVVFTRPAQAAPPPAPAMSPSVAPSPSVSMRVPTSQLTPARSLYDSRS